MHKSRFNCCSRGNKTNRRNKIGCNASRNEMAISSSALSDCSYGHLSNYADDLPAPQRPPFYQVSIKFVSSWHYLCVSFELNLLHPNTYHYDLNFDSNFISDFLLFIQTQFTFYLFNFLIFTDFLLNILFSNIYSNSYKRIFFKMFCTRKDDHPSY